ncbi:MAG: cation:proton antiporter [Candidatus Thiodiazotropha sp. (ex Myrtea spinifera)]|nr:cation:proton antiporter [Candidatus Thiodiazotropha sp. (ex Myrtea spinifera)]
MHSFQVGCGPAAPLLPILGAARPHPTSVHYVCSPASPVSPAFVLFFGLFFAQIISASLAARYTGKYSWEDSMMIGFGMLGRAELAFVVMDIAYVQYSILSTEAFYTLMFTAFWLDVAVPLTIRWWKPYYSGIKSLPLMLGQSRSVGNRKI